MDVLRPILTLAAIAALLLIYRSSKRYFIAHPLDGGPFKAVAYGTTFGSFAVGTLLVQFATALGVPDAGLVLAVMWMLAAGAVYFGLMGSVGGRS